MRPQMAPQSSIQMRPGMQRPPTRNFSPSPQATVIRRRGEELQQGAAPPQKKPSEMGATPAVAGKRE